MKEKSEISIQDLRRISLEIMDDIHNFCECNNIRYFLCGGTLIGAIRHKGFIPWDDDVDMVMLREDYDKFISLYQSDRFQLNSHKTKGYSLFFSKLCDTSTFLQQGIPMADHDIGVHVDIFPLDVLPDNLNRFVEMVSRNKDLWNLSLFYRHKEYGGYWQYLKVLLGTLLRYRRNYIKYKWQKHDLGYRNIEQIQQAVYENSTQYKDVESDYVGNVTWSPYTYKEHFKKEWFRDSVDVSFEGHLYKAPIDYDLFLRALYGDYMQLPPEDQRHSVHVHNIFWK